MVSSEQTKKQRVANQLDMQTAPKEISKIVGVCLVSVYNDQAAKNIGMGIMRTLRDDFLTKFKARIEADLTISMRQHSQVALSTIRAASVIEH